MIDEGTMRSIRNVFRKPNLDGMLGMGEQFAALRTKLGKGFPKWMRDHCEKETGIFVWEAYGYLKMYDVKGRVARKK